MTSETNNHFKRLDSLTVPAKRAAYSDRMAWMMSLLASIVYKQFNEEYDDSIKKMASDLAQLTSEGSSNKVEIEKRLREFVLTITGAGNKIEGQENTCLKALLAAGKFTLVGDAPIHIPETDTQAMVVLRQAAETEQPFVVLCFRGTKQVKDWFTNIKISSQPIANPKTDEGIIGNMHKGFHDAFKSAEGEIRARLERKEIKDLPLYITGHSLGGALAVVATWYLSSKTLAACYTFGAPRVGDDGLLGWFKTPIYRIVNFADPVPFAPLSGQTIDILKFLFRLLAAFFPWAGFFKCIVGGLIKRQNFRHYGDMKYLPNAKPVNGKYPDNFRINPSVSNLERLMRYVRLFFVKKVNKLTGNASKTYDRIDRYHGMKRYRDKLRVIAMNRNA